MTERIEIYRAFVSSPSDVAKERGFAEEAIRQINTMIRDTLGVQIDPRKWEQLSPVAPEHFPDERLQDLLLREVEKSQFFILILHKRYGTTLPNQSKSNTEREIDAILAYHQKRPDVKILTYFRELDPNNDPGDQQKQVQGLRSRLESLGLPYRRYTSAPQFKELLTHDLYDTVLRIKLSPFKKQALSRFWQFGQDERQHEPRLAIVYPPVERSLFVGGCEDDYWVKRLTTEISFEDYKAIEKVQKGLQLIGFKAFRVYPSSDAPDDLALMDRVWIGLPRNKIGLRELRHHDRLRFSFMVREGTQTIEWQPTDKQTVYVHSPMAEYLRQQRLSMDISRDWHRQLGTIVAKDFAVLARLRRPEAGGAEPVWDYVMSGIRGLGTWGAGWFVDHHARVFRDLDRDIDVQMLLEVEYRDGRIAQVTDVSDAAQEFFWQENSAETIAGQIACHED